MAYTTYSYSQSADFPNSVVSIGRLTKEVDSSLTISVKLSGISISGDDVNITFLNPLSPAEQAALAVIVAAHSGMPLPDVQITRTSPEKPRLDEEWFQSPNWADPTTWYQESVRVVNEELAAIDDERTKFKTKQSNLVDLVHGKVPMEDLISAPYLASVYVDGTMVYEDEPLIYDGSGKRDFDIDYQAGIVSFHYSIPSGSVVTMDYSWAKNSNYRIVPNPGKKISIQAAEAEFTTDFIMTDTVIYQAFVYAAVVSQEAGIDLATLQAVLTSVYGGTRDALFDFLRIVGPDGKPLQRDLQPLDKVPYEAEKRIYKTYWDFKSQSNGNYPIIPAVGGSLRGTRSSSITHPFDYRGAKELDSSIGAEARIWLKNHIPFQSRESKATATFYCLIEDL
jgi:hypothetical protein